MIRDDSIILEKIQNYEKLRTEKHRLRQHWISAFDYTFPQRGVGFEDSYHNIQDTSNIETGIERNRKLYTNVATHSTKLLASHIKSGVTPQNSLWFNCGLEGVSNADIDKSISTWLDQISRETHNHIHNSNYEEISLPMFIDLCVCGQAGLYCVYRNNKLTFEYWPFWSYVANDYIVYRLWNFSVQDLKKLFGKEIDLDLGEQSQYSESMLNKHKVLQCISKSAKAEDDKYYCEWIDVKNKVKLAEQHYNSNPFINLKWNELPNSNYCVGPVDDILPTVKSLNKLYETLIKNADMHVGGTYVTTRDGVFNANTARFGPRQVIIASSPDAIKPLQVGGDIGYAEFLVNDYKMQIHQGLMSNLLEPQDKTNQTATEVNVKSQLAYRLLSPILSRVGQKLSSFLVKRSISVLEDNNQLTRRPNNISGTLSNIVSVVYQSPVARAARLQDLDQISTFEQSMLQVVEGYPQTLDLYDADQSTRLKAEILGISSSLLRDEDQVNQIRQQRAEREAMQQQMEEQQ